MKTRTQILIIALTCLTLAACAGENGGSTGDDGNNPPTAGGAIDFATQIQPIFTANCSCHLGSGAPEGENLEAGTAYDTIVGMASSERPEFLRIDPGSPDDSYLVIKIDDNVPGVGAKRNGVRMPFGQAPLSRANIDLIRQWVAEGAARQAAPSDDTEPPEFGGALQAESRGPTSIEVFWEAPTDNDSAVDAITIRAYVATDPGGQDFSSPTGTSPAGSLSLVITGLAPDTTHYIVLRAVDGAGNVDANTVEVQITTDPPPPPPEGDIDFDTQIQPILQTSCALSGCHVGFTGSECNGTRGRCFESYEALSFSALDGFEVIPGNSAGSEMVKRIKGESTPRMPFGGDPLPLEQIGLIEAWIDQGALDSPPPLVNVAPVANPGGPYPGVTNTAVHFDGRASLDANGDSLTYAWNFGDGATGSGATPTHAYATAGTFTVSLVVDDGALTSSAVTTTVTVEEPPPPPPADIDFNTQVLPILQTSCALSGCHVGFTGSQCNGTRNRCFESYEALSFSALDGFEVIPGNGAGSEMVKRIKGESLPRMPLIGNFLTLGQISLIEAWIDQGAMDSPPPLVNVAPVANPGGPYSGLINTAIDFDGRASRDANGDSLTYAWNFGDGATGTGATPIHAYATAGTFTVSLVVDDGALTSSAVTTTVTVEEPPPPPPADIDFNTEILPILQTSCALSGCHVGFTGSQCNGTRNRCFESYAALSFSALDGFEVIPGNGAGSEMVRRIKGETLPRMPLIGNFLTLGQISLIEAWIDQGALDSPPSTDITAPQFNGITLAVPASPTSVDLFWNPATDDTTPAAQITYRIYAATISGGQDFATPTAIAPAGSSTTTVNGLTADTRYFFVVRAQDLAGNEDNNMVELAILTPVPPPPPPADIDFDTQILPLLRTNCVRCHGGYDAAAGTCNGILGRCFDTFTALEATSFDGFEVIPFNGAGSEMVRRIKGESVPRMPLDGPPFLTAAEIALIEGWIDTGARPSPPPAENRAPEADPGGPYTATVDTPQVLDGSNSFDLDGDPLAYNWDFGDGTVLTDGGAKPSHTYAAVGEFTVTLTVSDGSLSSPPATTTVTVIEAGLFPRNATMETICSQCHGVRIVLEDGTKGEITPPGRAVLGPFPPGFFMECNTRSAQGWADTVARMRNSNGCPMTDAEAQEIVDFLGANYVPSVVDPRQEAFTRVCSVCHSPTIPLSIPRSAGQWQSTVDRMISRYAAPATPAERDDIVGYLSDVALGTAPTELPEGEGRIYMNLVCSTCHSPKRPLDPDTGLPDANFRSFSDALALTQSMTEKGCGLRGVTDVIIAKWLSTTDVTLPDLISIDRYEYNGGTVEVRAWSSARGAATLTVTGEGGFSEVMENLGSGDYRLRVAWPTFPGRITVTSDLGGGLKWHRPLSTSDNRLPEGP